MKAIDYEAESEKRLNWLDITGGGAKDSLTVLDYFAGKALQGFIASQKYKGSMEDYVHDAYGVAELMLKEREKRHAPKGAVQGVTGKFYG